MALGGMILGGISIVFMVIGILINLLGLPDTNPTEYGGRGMALAGMILGGISIVFMVIGILIILLALTYTIQT